MKKILLISALFTIAISCKKKNPEPEPTPPAPVTSIGANYGGGIVFSLDEDGQHGYVITDYDLDTCDWSNGDESIVLPNSTDYYNQYGMSAFDVGAGKINTDLIVNALGNGNYAAKICKDLVLNGYDDWFLPSRLEIIMLKNSNIFSASPFNDTNPEWGFYWTSNELSATTALGMRLYHWQAQGDGQLHLNKNTTPVVKVRAIRRF